MDILLTTFPQNKSKNVGDNLITQSTLELIRSRVSNYQPHIVFREKPLNGYSKKKVKNIIAPGFSVSNNVYPELFTLYEDLGRLKNFFPIGCSFQHISPSIDAFNTAYNKKTLDFLKLIVDISGPLPCRDQLIVNMLNDRLNIPAIYSGDMAIYDEKVVNTTFNPPTVINSVVVTIQHHLKYLEQSIILLKTIKKEFPHAKLFIAYHSTPGYMPLTVASRAQQLGFEILHQYGEVGNLEFYKNIDLHIGYRLHGHIYFLRNRKPSILLVEDARSFGFAKTKGTSIGCFEAFSLKENDPCIDVPSQVLDFVRQEINNGFESYYSVFNFIDEKYNAYIIPYFESLSAQINKESGPLTSKVNDLVS
ncbi:MAG: hypothetical protein OFPII_34690 [Osedax symbiont Rs1]|nr:MAG: hypothetical protein OFPII_34690 [Osedax symbiont Rs1]